jgi:acyl carrier protein phosphodiesterase
MNYLAHAYLSFHDQSLIVGNMIADYVKGKQWQEYDPGIQQGIQLHRAIDNFTDTHPVTMAAREYFQPSCGRYSAVFIDIVYDHFLATDPIIFTDETLPVFSKEVYTVLASHHEILPPVFRQVFRHMQQYDWLYGYRFMDGIYKSFSGIVHRAKYLDVTADAPYAVLMEHYETLAAHYRTFFPELVAFVKTYTH